MRQRKALPAGCAATHAAFSAPVALKSGSPSLHCCASGTMPASYGATFIQRLLSRSACRRRATAAAHPTHEGLLTASHAPATLPLLLCGPCGPCV